MVGKVNEHKVKKTELKWKMLKFFWIIVFSIPYSVCVCVWKKNNVHALCCRLAKKTKKKFIRRMLLFFYLSLNVTTTVTNLFRSKWIKDKNVQKIFYFRIRDWLRVNCFTLLYAIFGMHRCIALSFYSSILLFLPKFGSFFFYIRSLLPSLICYRL